MRHLHAGDVEQTLRRGKSVEQFLGVVANVDPPGIVWIELRPREAQVDVWRHRVEDVGDEDWLDVYGFPALDAPDFDDPDYMLATPEEIDAAESARPERVFATASEALAHAHATAGCDPNRWVNAAVVQDEYRDFIRAGRPMNWPPR